MERGTLVAVIEGRDLGVVNRHKGVVDTAHVGLLQQVGNDLAVGISEPGMGGAQDTIVASAAPQLGIAADQLVQRFNLLLDVVQKLAQAAP
jgi:hypothetical protein